MKRAVILFVILSGSYSPDAQETEIRYLSGLDKDHTVKWDFFINNGMNSCKLSKTGVPSNWELHGSPESFKISRNYYKKLKQRYSL